MTSPDPDPIREELARAGRVVVPTAMGMLPYAMDVILTHTVADGEVYRTGTTLFVGTRKTLLEFVGEEARWLVRKGFHDAGLLPDAIPLGDPPTREGGAKARRFLDHLRAKAGAGNIASIKEHQPA